MSVLSILTDNSLKDNTGDDIGGAEVDANPQVIANVLDGTTIEALGTVAAVQFTAIDINGGTVDGATVGANSASTGAFTTLTSSSTTSFPTGTTIGNLTLANGSITDSSGAISFGNENLTTTGTLSAGATTVTSLNASDGNITNVGNIALDSISSDAGTTITVTLGSDAGDDLIVGSSYLRVHGDTGNVTLNTATEPSGSSTTGGSFISDIADAGQASPSIVQWVDSSNIAHGMTLQAATNVFGLWRKYGAAAGGILGIGFSDTSVGMVLRGFENTETTTDTSSSDANVMIDPALKSGTSVGAHGSTGNLFAVRNNGTTRMLLKGNGDMHITNTTLTALDAEDDIALVRAAQHSMSAGMGIAIDEWDKHLKATEDDLRRVGVLKGDFINLQRYNSLIGGSVVQLYKRMMEHAKVIEQNMPQLKGKLIPQLGA